PQAASTDVAAAPLAAAVPASSDAKTAVIDGAAASLAAMDLNDAPTVVGSLAASIGHSRSSSAADPSALCYPAVAAAAAAVATTAGEEAECEGGADVIADKAKQGCNAQLVMAGDFEQANHFYPRVLNAQIHPLVSSFFQLGNERIIARYVHLRPNVNQDKLREMLTYRPKHFSWAGSDLFNVTTDQGQHQMIIIETNSCPSGQKSMPLLQDTDECGGYRGVLRSAFGDLLKSASIAGELAVIYDKNHMEASGYAAAMAEESGEHVWLVEYHDTDQDPPVRWTDRVMEIRDAAGTWHAIRACFRYVTQRPWSRIPLSTRTRILNPVIACLAGGRNKMMAARAYEMLNAELR
ncbi:hypothetical protein GGI00_004964, partial [Coemansia sp. RSA 2681]